MKKIINIVCLALICFPVKGFCESDEDDFKLFTIGIGAGGFRANKYVANYYNGHPNNLNKVSYVLTNWEYEIEQEIAPYRFLSYECPAEMRYKVSTSVGFRVAMNLSETSSVFLQINQLNLTAADVIAFEIDSATHTSEKAWRMCQIWGKESRTMLDFGFQWRAETQVRELQWFYELAFNLTNTKVKENAIQIGNFQESLINRGNRIPNQPLNDPVLQNAIGVGLVGSFGVQYTLHPNVSLDIGLTGYLQDINLDGYEKFHSNFNLFFRINLLAV